MPEKMPDKQPDKPPVWAFRPVISDTLIARVLKILHARMLDRLNQHGWGIFVSDHEMLGVVTEEFQELLDAVKSNNATKVVAELEDLAVACIASLVSLRVIDDIHKEEKPEPDNKESREEETEEKEESRPV